MPFMLLGALGVLLFVGVAAKFGRYNVATLILMGVGAILFVIAPWNFFDSDVVGLSVFVIGLVMWAAGVVIRRARGRKGAS